MDPDLFLYSNSEKDFSTIKYMTSSEEFNVKKIMGYTYFIFVSFAFVCSGIYKNIH